MKKALIAMSGGVDSSVAACLMKEQGYDCIGATMKLFQNEDIGYSREHSCCSLDDVEDAGSVAHKLNIPYYVFNFSERFKECVIEKFVWCYENGITPNPCIDCNRYLKFDKLFHRAKELNCDYVVTGHYARTEYDPVLKRYLLKKAYDSEKDQTYFLYAMTQNQLKHTIFPLGELNKEQVRAIAREHDFLNAEKHDSQDICFVTTGNYIDFLKEYTGKDYPEGNFTDQHGNVIGRHKGIVHYTIGQRRGLNLSVGFPLYVCELDSACNTVKVGRDEDLYVRGVVTDDINLISLSSLEKPIRCKAKVRYSQKEQWATVVQRDKNTLAVEFEVPQKAVAKGQAIVLYDGDTVIGGGTIKETF